MDNNIEDKLILKILKKYPKDKSYSLEILQDMQKEIGYIPKKVFEMVSEYLNIKIASLYSLATFYKSLSLKPLGKNVITVCNGTACHIKGSINLVDSIKRLLNINPDETTEDRLFTLKTVNCLGACAIAPVLLINQKYYSKVTPDQLEKIIFEYKSFDRSDFYE